MRVLHQLAGNSANGARAHALRRAGVRGSLQPAPGVPSVQIHRRRRVAPRREPGVHPRSPGQCQQLVRAACPYPPHVLHPPTSTLHPAPTGGPTGDASKRPQKKQKPHALPFARVTPLYWKGDENYKRPKDLHAACCGRPPYLPRPSPSAWSVNPDLKTLRWTP